jgi:hypothetical protein
MKYKLLLGVGAVFLLVVILFVFNKYLFLSSFVTSFFSGDKVIAVVGNEHIYKKDLEYELSVHPLKDNPETSDVLIAKLIDDSVTIQGALSDKTVAIPDNVFNSANKDYEARIATVELIRNFIDQDSDKVSGGIVTVWFYNNGRIGTRGYEGSKNYAFDKITEYRNKVTVQNIPISEVGRLAMEDENLRTLDPAYKSNVYVEFEANLGDSITFDQSYDSLIRSLAVGELTETVLLKDVAGPGGAEPTDALYSFAMVTKRTGNGQINYKTWLEGHKENLEIHINE